MASGEPVLQSQEKTGNGPYNDDQLYGEEDDKDSFDGYFDDDSDDLELQELEEEDKALLEEMDHSMKSGTKLMTKSQDIGEGDDSSKAVAKTSTAVKGPKSKKEKDIGGDEEKEILKGIRSEIETKVRAEMKEELEGFKDRMRAIDSDKFPKRNPEATGEDGNAEDEDMDPKIKEAMEKMRKLDRILKKKIKKERSVKRDRLMLERRMRDEIAEMHHGATHYAEIKTNTERFLALAPPPSHNEGIDIEKLEEDDEDLPPLFATQVDDGSAIWEEGKTKDLTEEDVENLDLTGSLHGDSNQNTGRSGAKGSRAGKKENQQKKDFIKRNKELAADAGEMIAMTDDEKKRIKDLLQDVDSIPEMLEEESSSLEMGDSNPFQLSVIPGEGFRPDKVEMKSLTHIDGRLKAIMPEDDYRSIMDSSFSNTRSAMSQPPLFSRLNITSGADLPERFGERVLYETKEERELKARLDSIETQLDSFKANNDTELEKIKDEYGAGFHGDDLSDDDYGLNEDEYNVNSEVNNHLTDDQLDNLLNQCARDLSRMSYTNMDNNLDTPDLSARSAVSSRQSLMDNPPRLSETQLQQLLSEAHFPLSSSLMSNMDDDQKIQEESGISESIKAETWKAISEENGDNYNDEDDEDDDYDDYEDFAGAGYPDPSLSSSLANSSNNAVSNTQKRNDLNNPYSMDSDFESQPMSQNYDSHKMLQNGEAGLGASEAYFSGGRVSTSGSVQSTREAPTLPRINPNTSAWASFSADDDPSGSLTPSSISHLSQSRESSTMENIKLPDINSNSFLIQAPQGVKNNARQSAETLPSRKPLNMLHNDLTESRASIHSVDDSDVSRSLESSRSVTNRQSNGSSQFVPKPPLDSNPGRTSSRH